MKLSDVGLQLLIVTAIIKYVGARPSPLLPYVCAQDLSKSCLNYTKLADNELKLLGTMEVLSRYFSKNLKRVKEIRDNLRKMNCVSVITAAADTSSDLHVKSIT